MLYFLQVNLKNGLNGPDVQQPVAKEPKLEPGNVLAQTNVPTEKKLTKWKSKQDHAKITLNVNAPMAPTDTQTAKVTLLIVKFCMSYQSGFIITECNCNSDGSTSLQCNRDGVCECKSGFKGQKCNDCKDNRYGQDCQGLYFSTVCICTTFLWLLLFCRLSM